MKYIKPIIALGIITIGILWSCEKDDICAEETPTTPQLIIRFYDVSDPDVLKSVPSLFAYALDDVDNVIPIVGATVSTVDSIAIPLRTASTSTRFVLHNDFAINDNDTPDDDTDDFLEGNPDVITVSYDTEDVYVSRACGYKTVFNNINFDVEIDAENWIATSELINTSVTNEISAHVKVFH